jgi:hypothetical protein
MSDIQDLISKTTMDSIERGKILERERIIKIVEKEHAVIREGFSGAEWLVALIKGEAG